MSEALDDSEYVEIIEIINSQIASYLNYFKETESYLERYLTQLSKETFSSIVRRIQNQISHAFEIETDGHIERANEAIMVLDCFFKANTKREESDMIPHYEFQNENLNNKIDLAQQYDDWTEQLKQKKDPNMSFVNDNNVINYPWILDCQSKSDILLIDSRVKQKEEVDKQLLNTVLANPFGGPMDQYFAFLYIEINRETIIEDTLNSLIRQDINFRKPLRIQFVGELGVDEGGVQKEFFQLLIRKLFDPSYTMFTHQEESRMLWFNGNTFESNIKFELIGMLMGIAIYNQNILDLHLPMACYKKLLDI